MAIQNVTVIGAGNMGSGIAQAFAAGGFRVTLNDVSAEAVAKGLERIRKPLEKRVAEGKMPQAELDGLMARLVGQPDLAAAVADADMAVEAVFEDLKVKRDLFAKIDTLAPAKTILATNTSSFYVKDIAAATKRPDRVVGLHFFFPAAINKLLEVVKGPTTSSASFDAAFAAGKKAGKSCISTADAPGFAVNRFFVPWINEACRLLDENVANIPTIEAAAKDAFGITMGPFELMNVTGVPISLHAQSTLHKELGAFYEPAKGLRAQVERKANWDLTGPVDATKKAAVAARLRGVVYGIACHLVEAKVCTLRDTDRGATIGLRWAAGPFAMMNKQGTAKAAAEVQTLAGKWGTAFPMPNTLAKQAAANAPWHLPTVTSELLDGGQLALVTFDRPEALNALNETVLHDLDAVLADLEKARPRAVIVTGEGKAFIAGADIPTMRAHDVAGARAYTALGNRVLDRLAATSCPVLMAINGFALGGGLELALAGDLLYASEKAQLGLPEVGLGIHPGFGGTQRLPRRIGIGKAKEIVYAGKTIGAKEALAIGLVDGVVAPEALMEHCLTVARSIASKSPLAVAGAKSSIDHGIETGLAAGLRIEQESVALLFATQDKNEGMDSFLQKRAPRFSGR
ncbi:MAG: enoyl-CoA hydratase-related protein [Candidatus Thermoplasmatota archaeon]